MLRKSANKIVFRTLLDCVSDDFVCKTKSMTKSEFKDSCDVNHIISKFKKTGQLTLADQNMQFGDFSTSVDYHQACNVFIRAQEQFESLPAKLRKHFNNDPEEFLEFCSDEKNRDEMIKLNLIAKDKLPSKDAPGAEAADAGSKAAKAAAQAKSDSKKIDTSEIQNS